MITQLPHLFCGGFRLPAGQGGFLGEGNTLVDALPELPQGRLAAFQRVAAQLGGDFVHVHDHAQVCAALLENAGKAGLAHAVDTANNGIVLHSASFPELSRSMVSLIARLMKAFKLSPWASAWAFVTAF